MRKVSEHSEHSEHVSIGGIRSWGAKSGWSNLLICSGNPLYWTIRKITFSIVANKNVLGGLDIREAKLNLLKPLYPDQVPKSSMRFEPSSSKESGSEEGKYGALCSHSFLIFVYCPGNQFHSASESLSPCFSGPITFDRIVMELKHI